MGECFVLSLYIHRGLNLDLWVARNHNDHVVFNALPLKEPRGGGPRRVAAGLRSAPFV